MSSDPVVNELFWWVVGVGGTIIGALFWMIWNIHSDVRKVIKEMSDAITAFREEVAKDRASNGYVGEVDKRLNARLDRVEQKVDDYIAQGRRST